MWIRPGANTGVGAQLHTDRHAQRGDAAADGGQVRDADARVMRVHQGQLDHPPAESSVRFREQASEHAVFQAIISHDFRNLWSMKLWT